MVAWREELNDLIVSALAKRSKREGKTKTSTLPSYYSDFVDEKWRYVELALLADYSVVGFFTPLRTFCFLNVFRFLHSLPPLAFFFLWHIQSTYSCSFGRVFALFSHSVVHSVVGLRLGNFKPPILIHCGIPSMSMVFILHCSTSKRLQP